MSTTSLKDGSFVAKYDVLKRVCSFKVELAVPGWLKGLENEQVLLLKAKLHDEYTRRSVWSRPRALELLQIYTGLPPQLAEELFDLCARAPELFPDIVVTNNF